MECHQDGCVVAEKQLYLEMCRILWETRRRWHSKGPGHIFEYSRSRKLCLEISTNGEDILIILSFSFFAWFCVNKCIFMFLLTLQLVNNQNFVLRYNSSFVSLEVPVIKLYTYSVGKNNNVSQKFESVPLSSFTGNAATRHGKLCEPYGEPNWILLIPPWTHRLVRLSEFHQTVHVPIF